MKKSNVVVLVTAGILFFVGTVHASLVLYTDRTLFEAQGTIVEEYDFDDFTGASFYYPTNPWTTHGVTYTNIQNIIVGPSAGFGNQTNIICNNWYSPFMATLAGLYDMFGFDLGVLDVNSALDVSLSTNVGTYIFPGITVPNANQSPGMIFMGFLTGSGEYFTSLRIDGADMFTAPALDNVTLGNSGVPVPEPSTVLLIGAGFVGLALRKRRT